MQPLMKCSLLTRWSTLWTPWPSSGDFDLTSCLNFFAVPDEVVDPPGLWDCVHLVEDEDGGDVAEEAEQPEDALVEGLAREPRRDVVHHHDGVRAAAAVARARQQGVLQLEPEMEENFLYW